MTDATAVPGTEPDNNDGVDRARVCCHNCRFWDLSTICGDDDHAVCRKPVPEIDWRSPQARGQQPTMEWSAWCGAFEYRAADPFSGVNFEITYITK